MAQARFPSEDVLILGGTGSLGTHLVARLLDCGTGAIRVFSRDEQKQHDLRGVLRNDNVDFYLGDVRDFDRLVDAMRGATVVILAAALKQVPLCEEAPAEAVATNVVGAMNVRKAAIEAGVRLVIGASTDKAVMPVNVMGMTKALQERILTTRQSGPVSTSFMCIRYGNVLGSRGSVVPAFLRRIEERRPLPVTHPAMTRFLVTLDQAASFVMDAIESGSDREVRVTKCPAVRVVDLARTIASIAAGDSEYPISYVGIRAGEKIHELLISADEKRYADDRGPFFSIDRARYISDNPIEAHQAYSSETAEKLSTADIVTLLRGADLL